MRQVVVARPRVPEDVRREVPRLQAEEPCHAGHRQPQSRGAAVEQRLPGRTVRQQGHQARREPFAPDRVQHHGVVELVRLGRDAVGEREEQTGCMLEHWPQRRAGADQVVRSQHGQLARAEVGIRSQEDERREIPEAVDDHQHRQT